MPAWLQLMIDSFGPCSGRGLFYRAADPDYLRAGNRARLVGGAGQIIWSGPLVMLVRFYVWLIRHTAAGAAVSDFYGLPSAGIVLDAFTAAVIGFTLNIGAYSSEIIRATLAAIPKGQWDGLFHWHELAPGDVAGDPAAGCAHRGAAALQHLYLLGQRHLAGGGGDRARAVSGGSATRLRHL